mmetsp:Transcript_63890/g.71522  ORF Transcript_63890/g.71522 Transcript_63890/m.71522 type:complete len:455 (-) Transcript_63890:101-1465(-)
MMMKMSVLLSIYPIVQVVLLRVSLLLLLLLFNISSNSDSNSNSLVVVEAFCPVVICPGFGNDSIDYDTPLEQAAEVGLQSVLARRGFAATQIYTVPIKRQDWLRVATGLLDIPDFYVGRAKPTGLGYGWYVKRLKETVDRAYTESGGEKVLVIGHSAGGWLARAAMADGIWSESTEAEAETAAENDENKDEAAGTSSSTVVVRTSERIRCLATIGSIHAVPDQEATCVTRGALKYTDENYPGAYLKQEGIGYVSIGGAAIVGDNEKKKKKDNTNGNDTNNKTVDPEKEKKEQEEDEQQQLFLLSTNGSSSEVDDFYATRGEGSANRVAYTSYKAVSGNGNLLGDGVVPLQWTQLAGAKQLTLDNVLHSINEAGTTFPTDRWYGSEAVIDRWLPTVLEECGNLVSPDDRENNNNNNNTILEGVKQGIAAILFQEKKILLPLYISLCVGYFIYRYT